MSNGSGKRRAARIEDSDVADFLILALKWNLIEPQTVVAWADSIIADRAEPPYWAIDLSMPPRPKEELIALLQSVPGVTWSGSGTNLFVAWLHQKWTQGELSGPQIGRILYGLLQERNLPERLGNSVYAIDDGYDLAEQGIFDRKEIDKNLESFLESYLEYYLPLREVLHRIGSLGTSDAGGYEKVLEVLREWDPIGIISERIQDEYDCCAASVVKLLDAGATADDLRQHLIRLADKHMGILADEKQTQACAEKLVKLWRELRK